MNATNLHFLANGHEVRVQAMDTSDRGYTWDTWLHSSKSGHLLHYRDHKPHTPACHLTSPPLIV